MSLAINMRRKAVLVLLLVCLIWAGAFVGLETGPAALREIWGEDRDYEISTFFLFARFGIAALCMPFVFPSCVRDMNRGNVLTGFWLGLLFSVHLLLQVIGLAYAEMQPGQAAFLVALFVVFAPIFAFVLQGRRPRLGVLIGIPLATVGAAFINGPPETGFSLAAWLNIGAAAVYGLQIVVTDTLTKKGNTQSQTFWMICSCAALCGLAFVCSPRAWEMLSESKLMAVAQSSGFWISEIYLALVSSVLALALLNAWQKEISPNHAAIIFTCTPVFATALSVAMLGEAITFWLIFGAAMIVLANLAAELIGRAPTETEKGQAP